MSRRDIKGCGPVSDLVCIAIGLYSATHAYSGDSAKVGKRQIHAETSRSVNGSNGIHRAHLSLDSGRRISEVHGTLSQYLNL